MDNNAILLLTGTVILGYSVVYVYTNRHHFFLKIFDKIDYLIDFKNWIKQKFNKNNAVITHTLNNNQITIKHIITKSYIGDNYNIPLSQNNIDIKNGVTHKNDKNYLNLNFIKQSFPLSNSVDNCIEIGYEFNNIFYQHIFTNELFSTDELEIEQYLNTNFQKSVKIPIDSVSLMNNNDVIKLDVDNNKLVKIIEYYMGPLTIDIKMKYIKNNLIAMLDNSVKFTKLIVKTILLEEFEYNDNDILIN